MNASAVFDIRAGGRSDHITQPNAKIFAHYFVQSYLDLVTRFIGENDADRVLSFLALENHIVPSEEIQFLHLLEVERHDSTWQVSRPLSN